MPYKKKVSFVKTNRSKSRARWAKKKAKSRQQRLSVKTVENISKKVARRLDNENTKTLKNIVEFGTQHEGRENETLSLPVGFRLTLRGAFDEAGDAYLQDFWFPRTKLVETQENTGILDLKDGDRVGPSVFCKGLRIVGNFILPVNVYRATFYLVICRKLGDNYPYDAEIIQPHNFMKSPYNYNEKKDLDKSMSVLSVHKWSMRQRTGRNGIYNDEFLPVDKYISINKKCDYQILAGQTTPTVYDKSHLKKPPYEFRLYSDMPMALINGELQELDEYPQFQGKIISYYSCS